MSLNDMSKEQKQYIVLGVLAAVILIVLLVFGVRFSLSSIADARGELAVLVDKIETADRTLANRTEVSEDFKRTTETLKEQLKNAPPERNYYSWATEVIYSQARQIGLEIESIEEIAGKQKKRANQGEDTFRLEAYALRINARGGYNNVKWFLRGMKEGYPLVRFTGVEIAGGDDPESHKVQIWLQWPFNLDAISANWDSVEARQKVVDNQEQDAGSQPSSKNRKPVEPKAASGKHPYPPAPRVEPQEGEDRSSAAGAEQLERNEAERKAASEPKTESQALPASAEIAGTAAVGATPALPDMDVQDSAEEEVQKVQERSSEAPQEEVQSTVKTEIENESESIVPHVQQDDAADSEAAGLNDERPAPDADVETEPASVPEKEDALPQDMPPVADVPASVPVTAEPSDRDTMSAEAFTEPSVAAAEPETAPTEEAVMDDASDELAEVLTALEQTGVPPESASVPEKDDVLPQETQPAEDVPASVPVAAEPSDHDTTSAEESMEPSVAAAEPETAPSEEAVMDDASDELAEMLTVLDQEDVPSEPASVPESEDILPQEMQPAADVPVSSSVAAEPSGSDTMSAEEAKQPSAAAAESKTVPTEDTVTDDASEDLAEVLAALEQENVLPEPELVQEPESIPAPVEDPVQETLATDQEDHHAGSTVAGTDADADHASDAVPPAIEEPPVLDSGDEAVSLDASSPQTEVDEMEDLISSMEQGDTPDADTATQYVTTEKSAQKLDALLNTHSDADENASLNSLLDSLMGGQ